MLGCYVHIPFCARRCPYCDFAVSVDARQSFRERYVAALQSEINGELEHFEAGLDTVFFGGGTPTELPAETLCQILAPILQKTKADAEISLEANPENLTFDFLWKLREGGFNRISLGAQSFDARELQVLGRAHDASKIENAAQDARRAGFENLSLDLIYGAPESSVFAWRQSLERAIALDLTHVSAYCLTIEDGTAFGKRVEKGEMPAPDADLMADLMDETAQTLERAGFERYEVSNWAKPGFESRHNRNYWRGGDYLGFGCGAHGHRQGHRFWNERDAKTYVSRIENKGSARAGEEKLTPRERAVELVALGVRQREGFDLAQLSRIGAFDARAALNASLSSFVSQGMLCETNGRVAPEPRALALADGMAARLVAQF
ncbi:radical SAM family heme chaperone HemW [Abditibacterium utsteinense]|uniref:radical SAM family heme chaperone HemW n=1 Tax=Abditibacterium utsteinense TaxID=1960156 RepID=UPI0013006411|nr:radical SAM family heme chaperone HemW [Abditibacterium utsteinense]